MAELLEARSPRGRLLIATVTLGSGIALLDSTVVNIAVRTIGPDLSASLVQLQWVLNGYLLSLASLILVGGSLGDRFGRRRIYLAGVAGFAVASAMCALAQTPNQLVAFRIIQGVAAALLTPGALALIQSSLRPADRAAAIGTWAGVSGMAAAIGPFVGGFLLEHGGWRWIFAINIPLCVLVVLLGLRIPESRDEANAGRLDIPGAVLGVAGLGATTYALTSWRTMSGALLTGTAVVAVLATAGFLLVERRTGAMLPLELFASRVFAAANMMTFLVYGALGGVIFLLVLQLQVSAGYGPIAAGLATLPITISMLLLSSRFSVLAARIGPRLPMTFGPLVCAAGAALLSTVGREAPYWTQVFPGMLLFSLGLSGLVAPLTTAVLAAAPDRHAGVASGVNNAVARAGSLLVVAALPALVGLHGKEYADPALLTRGYQAGLLVCAALLAGGGIVSWFGLAGTQPLAGGE
ncbi:MAG: MFS transporter [Actinomycetota bacterium]|nr:MFS transporter [Actinomycetota bacterium]